LIRRKKSRESGSRLWQRRREKKTLKLLSMIAMLKNDALNQTFTGHISSYKKDDL
jgi:phage gp46-like protein